MSGVKLPWHKRALPPDWDAEEVLFFTNWRRELAKLHRVLTCTAIDRLKVLRRARRVYFKLGYTLDERIRRATIRLGDSTKSGCPVKGGRR
jgi:hypothetical protein